MRQIGQCLRIMYIFYTQSTVWKSLCSKCMCNDVLCMCSHMFVFYLLGAHIFKHILCIFTMFNIKITLNQIAHMLTQTRTHERKQTNKHHFKWLNICCCFHVDHFKLSICTTTSTIFEEYYTIFVRVFH